MGDTPEHTKSGFLGPVPRPVLGPRTGPGTGPGTLVLLFQITCSQPVLGAVPGAARDQSQNRYELWDRSWDWSQDQSRTGVWSWERSQHRSWDRSWDFSTFRTEAGPGWSPATNRSTRLSGLAPVLRQTGTSLSRSLPATGPGQLREGQFQGAPGPTRSDLGASRPKR